MTTPHELARKVATYLASVCPPPGVLRWQDYLTGDDESDRPVLYAVADALGITTTQLFERALAHKAKRVCARYRGKVEVANAD